MAMAASKQVKVTEVCRVKPAPNPSEKKTISSSSSDQTNNYFPLTFFDTVWLRFPPTQRIFFYEIHHLSSDLFYNTILPNLKHSLSLTLQHYPSLAGNLTWHPDTANPVIRYSVDHDGDDGGVPFSVAESCTLDFDALSTDNVKEAKHLHHLLPDFHFSESKANVLSLQLTLFPSYGFSIGFCVHHASMDGKSTAMFIKSWTTICRLGSLPPELMPNHETRSILMDDPLKLSPIFIDHWMKLKLKMIDGNDTTQVVRSLLPMDKKPAPGLLKRTFRLTPEQVREIKGKLIKIPVSSFTAVCSYIWTCLVKAEKGDITKENVYLNINVDCRGRWEPPVPENYFGNCVTYRFAKAKVESLESGDGVAAAAAAISEAIGSLGNGGVMKGAEKWLSEVSWTFRNEKVYGIGGSTWFDLYGADFGWGRPRKVEMVSIDRNSSLSLCDARDGDDGVIEIGIVLTKVQMETFESIFAQQLSN